MNLDVPFASGIIGFKPSSLPPVSKEERGIRIGHIQSGHWADRVGLRAGDIITHINGNAVSSMRTGREFIDALSPRPLRLVVEIGVSPGEVTSAFQSFDWTSRMNDVNHVRSATKDNSGEANEMFERVFDAKLGEKSSLFDVSSWLSKKQSAPEEEARKTPPSVASSHVREIQGGAVQIMFQNTAPRIESKSIWIPSKPICLWYKVEQGYGIPERAGTLGLDYLMQPFSSEPMVELSLIIAPPQVTLDILLAAKPVEVCAKTITGICDATYVWDAQGSLIVTNKDMNLKDLMILGKLQDYRRLEEAKTMGVFAIRLDNVEVSDNLSKATSSLVTLTSAEPVSFNLTNTKIKLTLCLKGSLTMRGSSPQSNIPSKVTTPITLSSASSSIGTPEIQELGDEESPKTGITIAPQAHVDSTPFERAYKRALSDIRQGDNSSIKMQNLTIR